MHPLVLGTAGHVDHGKTSLVKALTGIDTDRLKEEKERGITIELGFAHLQLPSGDVLALVDVPGHERFVRTMVAGAGGIDAVLLVVAADEGVMPQTREHLDICGLLGIRAGVVALTKVDLLSADPELLAVAELELRDALRGTFLQQAAIVPCSAQTGVGLAELQAELVKLLAGLPARDAGGLPRLPIDRVFALRGFGTVITGTLWSGGLRVGDELSAQPGMLAASERMKVRGLHVHGQPVSEARAGQRVAVNLAVAREHIERGQTLIAPHSLLPCSVCEIELRYLPAAKSPLKRRSQLLLHTGTTWRLGSLTLLDTAELAPGEQALAQLRVPRDKPLLLMPGDHFVLRGFAAQSNHGTTVGGGMVLRCGEPSREALRRAAATAAAAPERSGNATDALRARAQALHALSLTTAVSTQQQALKDLLLLALADASVRGASLSELRMQVPIALTRLQATLVELIDSAAVVSCQTASEGERGSDGQLDGLYVTAATLHWLHTAATICLREFHHRDPTAAGLSPETLRSQLQKKARILRPAVLARAMQDLWHRRAIVAVGNLVRLAEHGPPRDPPQSALVPHILAIYQQAGLAPPRSDELLAGLQARAVSPMPSPNALAKVIDGLCRGGLLLRIKDLYFLRSHVEALQARLVAYLQQHREIGQPAWKELVGQSRKFSIPLAEYFDAEKVTLRVGDLRRLRAPPRSE